MGKKTLSDLDELIIDNIRKIMNDKNLTQAAIGQYMDIEPPTMSKIFKKSQPLTLDKISKLATSLSIKVIDIITYPDVYVLKDEKNTEPVEAILQIKLTKEKKEQVLKLVFGENNIEILNK